MTGDSPQSSAVRSLLEEISVPRDKHQDGWVEETGKRIKKWKGHWHPYINGKRTHSTLILGLKSKMRKWEAEDALRRHIEKETGQQARLPIGQPATFAWFWIERFMPTRAWNPNTEATLASCFKQHVLPVIGATPLKDIDKFTVDSLVKRLAGDWSKSVVQKVRTYLKAALEEAVDQDFIQRNPARKITRVQTRATCKRFLSLEEIAALLGVMEARDRLICRVCLLLGLRPGELFACRWDDFDPERGRLRIDESAAEWGIKETKTPGSTAWVWVPESLVRELRAWQETSPQSPSGLMSPSSAGTPLRTKNFLRRNVWPAAIRAGLMQEKPKYLPKGTQWVDRSTSVNFKAFRRTCATWFQQCGTAKDIQAHLRHSTPTTTLGVYVQEIPESVRLAVEALDQKLGSKSLETATPQGGVQ